MVASTAPTPLVAVPLIDPNRPPTTTWPAVRASELTAALAAVLPSRLRPTPVDGAQGSSWPAVENAARRSRSALPTALKSPPT